VKTKVLRALWKAGKQIQSSWKTTTNMALIRPCPFFFFFFFLCFVPAFYSSHFSQGN
jgi:hypothetical protein